MKKLILVMCAVLFIAACTCKTKPASNKGTGPSEKISAQTDDTLITLNGVGFSSAEAMKSQFAKYQAQDISPTRQSVWFDITTIHQIVDLLEKEIAEQKNQDPGRTDITDGIRIYFTSDLQTSTAPLKNSIILVSTKNDGPNDTVPSLFKHKDYYEHSKKDVLFNDPAAIRGGVSPKGSNNGELSYDPCKNCDVTLPCVINEPHYITRKKAYDMLNAFQGKPIKTTSEWFDLELFRAFAKAGNIDGVRIYFARHLKEPDPKTSEKEAFILFPTKYNPVSKCHDDDYDCGVTQNYINYVIHRLHGANPLVPIDGGQDNGELCPDNCDQ